MNFFHYISDNADEIVLRFQQHVEMTIIALVAAVVIGVPLGVLISFKRSLYRPVMGFANLVQAVPSLALLGFVIPLLGIGTLPAVCLVSLYSLLPIIKNTATGLNNVDPELVEAAKGIGLTRMQILSKVKFPLALPVIMAGVRISAVTAVGLATLAALIGAGGLGYLVYSGIRTVSTYQILSGAIPACLLALLMDFLAGSVETAVIPLGIRRDAKSLDKERIAGLRTRNRLVLATMAVVLLAFVGFSLHGRLAASRGPRAITIGTKDFTEQVILGHMYSELVEAKTDIAVNRRFQLGGNRVIFAALDGGEVDMYVDYTGTLYSIFLKHSERRSTEEVYEIVKKEMAEQFNLTVMDPLGFNNTFAIMVTGETAKRYNLKKVSDLARVAADMIAGPGIEFLNRPDGMSGLQETYGLRFKEVVPVDGVTPKYVALLNRQTDMAESYSTDSLVQEHGMVLLEDDKHFFPPYYAVPVARPAVLEKYPELRAIFNSLAGKFNDDIMRNLNYQVEVEQKHPRQVAIDFLKKNGLL